MRVYFVIYCTPFDMVNNNFVPLSAIKFCMCFYFTLPRYPFQRNFSIVLYNLRSRPDNLCGHSI